MAWSAARRCKPHDGPYGQFDGISSSPDISICVHFRCEDADQGFKSRRLSVMAHKAWPAKECRSSLGLARHEESAVADDVDASREDQRAGRIASLSMDALQIQVRSEGCQRGRASTPRPRLCRDDGCRRWIGASPVSCIDADVAIAARHGRLPRRSRQPSPAACMVDRAHWRRRCTIAVRRAPRARSLRRARSSLRNRGAAMRRAVARRHGTSVRSQARVALIAIDQSGSWMGTTSDCLNVDSKSNGLVTSCV